MRLVMMGTGPFGAPTFRGLFQTEHTIVALVTGPLKSRGGRPAWVSPNREIAQEHNTPIYDPDDVNTEQANRRLRQFEADLLVVCDFGQILSAATLATTRLGGINLHASLLPKYRGAAPIHWAVYHGETETGVSVIHMTPRVDAGPVIAQAKTAIGPEETAAELEPRLAELGAPLVREAIESLAARSSRPIDQDPALASKAPRIKKTDGLVDWSRPAAAIKNQVRAMEPWPKTYTFWHRGEGSPLRLILGPVSVVETPPSDAPPGTVLEAEGHRLVVAAGQGAVAVSSLQPAGKKLLAVEQFLRGYRVRPGDRLGPE